MTKELRNNLRVINDHRAILSQKYHVKEIGIFGSFAKGTHTKTSDIDVLVEFSRPVGFFKFIGLENYLSTLTKKKVDLVTKQALKPVIKSDILREVIYA